MTNLENKLETLEEQSNKARKEYDILCENYDRDATNENFENLLSEMEEAKTAYRDIDAEWHLTYRKLNRAA